jgi:hypothetical protein
MGRLPSLLASLVTISGMFMLGAAVVPTAAQVQHVEGCCHATACSTISSADLTKGAGETYTVTATGELFFPPESTAGGSSPKLGRAYQWSDDGEFHRCGTSSVTRCLRVPRPGA